MPSIWPTQGFYHVEIGKFIFLQVRISPAIIPHQDKNKCYYFLKSTVNPLNFSRCAACSPHHRFCNPIWPSPPQWNFKTPTFLLAVQKI